jgi:hypothetical protein
LFGCHSLILENRGARLSARDKGTRLSIVSADFNFEPDDRIASMAETAVDMIVDATHKIFDISLDGSEESIERVDAILNQLHDRSGVAEVLDQATRTSLADAFGFYAGQLFCRYRGGTWGVLIAGGDRVPAVRDGQGRVFSPVARAHRQLDVGSADSLAFFYRYLAGSERAASK